MARKPVPKPEPKPKPGGPKPEPGKPEAKKREVVWIGGPRKNGKSTEAKAHRDEKKAHGKVLWLDDADPRACAELDPEDPPLSTRDLPGLMERLYYRRDEYKNIVLSSSREMDSSFLKMLYPEEEITLRLPGKKR